MFFTHLKTHCISFSRQYNVDYKLDTYLKIARLYLEDDDPVQAEAYINRASLLQNESSNEQLQIHYKVCRPTGFYPKQKAVAICWSEESHNLITSSCLGVLCKSPRLQEEVHWSCTAVQWAVLQVHRPWEWTTGGTETRPELHYTGLCRYDGALFVLPALHLVSPC